MTLDRAPNATSYCRGWWWELPETTGRSLHSYYIITLLVWYQHLAMLKLSSLKELMLMSVFSFSSHLPVYRFLQVLGACEELPSAASMSLLFQGCFLQTLSFERPKLLPTQEGFFNVNYLMCTLPWGTDWSHSMSLAWGAPEVALAELPLHFM